MTARGDVKWVRNVQLSTMRVLHWCSCCMLRITRTSNLRIVIVLRIQLKTSTMSNVFWKRNSVTYSWKGCTLVATASGSPSSSSVSSVQPRTWQSLALKKLWQSSGRDRRLIWPLVRRFVFAAWGTVFNARLSFHLCIRSHSTDSTQQNSTIQRSPWGPFVWPSQRVQACALSSTETEVLVMLVILSYTLVKLGKMVLRLASPALRFAQLLASHPSSRLWDDRTPRSLQTGNWQSPCCFCGKSRFAHSASTNLRCSKIIPIIVCSVCIITILYNYFQMLQKHLQVGHLAVYHGMSWQPLPSNSPTPATLASNAPSTASAVARFNAKMAFPAASMRSFS